MKQIGIVAVRDPRDFARTDAARLQERGNEFHIRMRVVTAATVMAIGSNASAQSKVEKNVVYGT